MASTSASVMIRDKRGRFVARSDYAGCTTYEQHGDCNCSTGVGFTCHRAREGRANG